MECDLARLIGVVAYVRAMVGPGRGLVPVLKADMDHSALVVEPFVGLADGALDPCLVHRIPSLFFRSA
jgi:hypothetical protein